MTTAEHPRAHVPIAGVAWPAYKLIALAVGLITLLLVAAVTASAAAAVLTAAGSCTTVWLALGPLRSSRR